MLPPNGQQRHTRFMSRRIWESGSARMKPDRRCPGASTKVALLLDGWRSFTCCKWINELYNPAGNFHRFFHFKGMDHWSANPKLLYDGNVGLIIELII